MMGFRQVMDLIYRKTGVRYHGVHIYRLLHKWGFKSKVPQKRFVENNYYLILTMDFDQYDFDKIITEKIIPLIKQEKEKFVSNNINKDNLDYIRYKFHDKDFEFYSWKYEILRDNDKAIILRLDIKLLQKILN